MRAGAGPGVGLGAATRKASVTAGLAAAFVFALLLSGPAAQQGGFVLTIRPDGSTERALQWVEAVLVNTANGANRRLMLADWPARSNEL